MSVTAVPLQPVKRAYKVWIWLGVLAAIVLAAGLAWAGTRAVVAAKGTNEQYLAWNKGQLGVKTTASGLQYQVLKPGEGPNAGDGDLATASLEGKLRDGTVFQPKAGGQIPVGQGMIPGFTEALKLMNKGSKIRVWVPPSLGYADAPPQSPQGALRDKVLIFDITMEDLMPAAAAQQMMMQQMMQQQMQQGGPPPGGPEGGALQGAPEGGR